MYFQRWVRHEFYTYILLKKNNSPVDLEAKLPGFIDKYAAEEVKNVNGGSLASHLQPLRSIHLYSDLQLEISPNGDIKDLSILKFLPPVHLKEWHFPDPNETL